MKLSLLKLVLLTLCALPLGVLAQSIFQNAYLTNYLNHSLTTRSSVSIFGGLPYDGIGKNDLLSEIPNTLIGGFSYDYDANSLLSPMYGTLRGSTPKINNRLSAEFIGSHLNEMQLTITNQNNNGGWSNRNAISGYRNQKIQDVNDDGFRDLPTKDRLFAYTDHLWSKDKLTFRLKAFYLNVDEVSGQTSFDKTRDYLTTNAYGFGNETMHTGFIFFNEIKLGERYKPIKQSLEIYADGRLYDQTAFYGQQERFSSENLLNTYVAYTREGVLSKSSIGVAYRQQNINIDFNSNTYAQNYDIDRLSIFGDYETYVLSYGKIEAKGRLEYENGQVGFYPNLQLKANIGKANHAYFSRVNLYAGREKRLFLPTMEYEHFLNSSRIVDFPELDSDNYYEKGYYLGGAWQKDYKYFYLNFGFWHPTLEVRRTKLMFRQERLTNYWIPTVSEPSTLYNGTVTFENGTDLWTQNIAEGSTRISLEQFILKIRYRYTQPDKDYDYQLTPKHIWALQLSRYRIVNSLSSSVSYFYQGKQSLNGSDELADGTHRWDWMLRWQAGEIMNLRKFSGTSIIFGINNFTNNQSNNLIISPENPFSPMYDGSANLGQQFNRTFFIGIDVDFD